MNASPPPVVVPRPDVTPAQALAITGWVVAQAVAYGWLGPMYEQVAVSIGATALAVGWKLADAVIRSGRNRTTIPPTTAAPPSA